MKRLLFIASFFIAACGDDAPVDPMYPSPPPIGVQVDRVGRPGVVIALLHVFDGDDAARDTARDDYNDASRTRWSIFGEDFGGALAIYDGLDGRCGDQWIQRPLDEDRMETRYMPLTGLLTDDRLFLDTSAECSSGSDLLGTERHASALPRDARGCGGRDPTLDVIDPFVGLLVGNDVSLVSDGVDEDGDCALSSTEFPYLCAPE